MDVHTSPSMAWRDFPLTVPEVFGRSLIPERRKGLHSPVRSVLPRLEADSSIEART